MTHRCSSFLVLAVLACLPAPAYAQATPSTEAAVSYSFLRFEEGDGYNMPAGWLLSVSRPVAPWLSVVGEASGNYRSDEGDWLQVHGLMGGVRISPVARTGARPFAQVVAGAAVASCCGETDTRFAVEPGAGVDLPIGDRTAARIGVSFPVVFADGDTTNLLRFQAGVVFRLGAR